MSSQLMALALVPGILIIIYVYRKDKVEKEPRSLIIKLVIFGALASIPAILGELYVDSHFVLASPKLAYAMSSAFLSAALCEEVSKFALLMLGSWKNQNFNYRFDGIVYGVSVAVGFALLENILYVADGGFSTAIMRAVLAVPLHAFCGAFMGMFYGSMMKNYIDGNGFGVVRCLFGALAIPILIHGIYDTFAFLGTAESTIMLLVFVALMYFLAIKFVNKYSREDWNAAFFERASASNSYGANYNSGFGTNYNMDDFKLYREDVHSDRSKGGSVVLTCPACRSQLRVPQGAGHIRVTCTNCRQKFESYT